MKKTCGCVARVKMEGFVEGEEWEVISGFVSDLSFLEKWATHLRAQVGVGPWECEVVRRVALGSKFCGSISELVAHDACIGECPPYLDF